MAVYYYASRLHSAFFKTAPPSSREGKRSPTNVHESSTLPDWALTADDDDSLVYEDGILVSGSLEALIQHATPTLTYYPDPAYLFAFFLSARLFISPRELLQHVCNLGFTQQGLKTEDMDAIQKDKLEYFLSHMVRFLGQWMETLPYDFRDDNMMAVVRILSHRCAVLQPSARFAFTQILHDLLRALTVLESFEEKVTKYIVPSFSTASEVTYITEICPNEACLAHQLLHIENEYLRHIGPEEFIQMFAMKNVVQEKLEDQKLTRNFEYYINWFHRLTYIVSTQVCTLDKRRQRTQMIEWWIEVASNCLSMGNFNSLMAILTGLNTDQVFRLKKTWSKVHMAKYYVLEHQMDPTNDFFNYRSRLSAMLDTPNISSVGGSQNANIVPVFSLFVKDLHYHSEKCLKKLPNGHVNFQSFWKVAKLINEFTRWKQMSTSADKVDNILQYLHSSPLLSEKDLFLASFEKEAPENNMEKEQFKCFKSELSPS